MIKGTVKGQNFIINQPLIVSDTIDYLEMQFIFHTLDWQNLQKWAHFKQGETVWDIMLKDDRILKSDHLNLSEGEWEVYLHGNDTAGTMRITTEIQKIKVAKTGTLNGSPLPDIPLSAEEQISIMAQNAEKIATSVKKDFDILNENIGADVQAVHEAVKKSQDSALASSESAKQALQSENNAKLSETNAKASEDKVNSILYNNAGAHNSIYRGKNLGTNVTAKQWTNIKNGTFEDLYIGDYWNISGVNYRIAAFDYYFNTGDTVCTKHHAVIVPDTQLYAAQMHNTPSGSYEAGAANTTEGGYVGSDMYKTNLEKAKTTIENAFAGHVLKHRLYLTNAVSDGCASASLWVDSEVELMTEHMVYGCGVFSPVSDGSSIPSNSRIGKSQLPLFTFRPDLISNRQWYWLRDVVSAACFAYIGGTGFATYHGASDDSGVRPAFSIC